jgi:hypothetical protein
MNETPNPPDWAIKAALERIHVSHDQLPLSSWRDGTYAIAVSLAASLIAKHEQPPVDEDREALIRILQAADIGPDDMFPNNFARAVAQYKQERAK